jgi:hypothetical protein
MISEILSFIYDLLFYYWRRKLYFSVLFLFIVFWFMIKNKYKNENKCNLHVIKISSCINNQKMCWKLLEYTKYLHHCIALLFISTKLYFNDYFGNDQSQSFCSFLNNYTFVLEILEMISTFNFWQRCFFGFYSAKTYSRNLEHNDISLSTYIIHFFLTLKSACIYNKHDKSNKKMFYNFVIFTIIIFSLIDKSS